ncbi:MAG: ModD protein [Coriobacteriales bacterium]|jgi:molybdenum transport protein
MAYIPHGRIEYFIGEDVPYLDLTSHVLGIADTTGEMEYFTREACVVAGIDEAARVAETLGCDAEPLVAAGDAVAAGDSLLRVRGSADALHKTWKVGLNLLDHLSAIATKTRQMVDAVHAVAPGCEVLTTRKSMPGVKDLITEAVVLGGAYPHRLGLSETVLVFDQHIEFMGGLDAFIDQIPVLRRRCIEKKFFVESTVENALRLASAGVDGIQFDKASPDEIARLVPGLRTINPRITLIAAGGVNLGNAAEYAKTGIDGIATTSPLSAKPLDMSVRMIPLPDTV